MPRDEDVKIVFNAADEFSAVLQKANVALGGITASSSRLQKELLKWTDAGEYAAGSMKRLRNIMEGFAFGVVAGAVSAVTQEFINMWQRSFNAEEIMNKLNATIVNQAGSWKILPEPMRAVAQSTVDIYNAQLKLSQFYGVSEIPKLKNEIADLQKANEMAGGEIYQNTQLFGPYNAGLFNAEILNRKNQETILQNNVTLAGKRDKLRQLVEIQDLQATSLEKVNSATSKQTELVSESVLQDRNWLTLNLAYMGYLKTEEENFRQRLLSTPLNIYWLPSDEEISRKVSAITAAKQALIKLEEKSPYDYMAGLQDAAAINEFARASYMHESKLNMLRQYNTNVITEMMNAGATQQEIQTQFTELSIGYAEKEAQSKWMVYASLANQLGALSGQLYTSLGESQKTFFYMQRALAVASILINTEVAAAAATAPPPIGAGPILGIPLATWIRVTGYASAAMTAATSFMGGNAMVKTSPGGFSSETASTSIGGGSSASIPAPMQTQQAAPSQNISINVYALDPSSVNWDRLTENNIIPAINNAGNRNVKMNVNVIQA